jgi:hypothetical protein
MQVISERERLTRRMAEVTMGTVVAGPFAGMGLGMHAIWGDDDIASKLLGCYEHLLHPVIESLLASTSFSHIINVGCADGYYAIGFARRLPTASIFCVDLNPRSKDALSKNAGLNSIAASRIRFTTESTPEVLEHALRSADGDASTLVFMDCEGSELDLLDIRRAPSLASPNVTFIIECHDHMRSLSLTADLTRRFSGTHEATIVREPVVNPLPPSLPNCTAHLTVRELLVTLDEHRCVPMHWLVLTPRKDGSPPGV